MFARLVHVPGDRFAALLLELVRAVLRWLQTTSGADQLPIINIPVGARLCQFNMASHSGSSYMNCVVNLK